MIDNSPSDSPCPGEPCQPATLADLLLCLEGDSRLTESQRRNMCSAIRRLCRALNVRPADAPANLAWVRDRTNRLHPVQAGISAKRLANIRSEVARAIKHCIPGPYGRRGRERLVAPWADLRDQLNDRRLRYQLSRFLTYLSARGLERIDVDDSLLPEFHDWLEQATTAKNPDCVVKQTVRSWNRAVTSVPGWPQQMLTDSWRYQGYTRQWDALPESLRRDAEAWLETLRNPDLLDEHAPNRPLSKETIEARRFSIRQIHGALIQQGADPDSLMTLADLTTVAHMKLALRFFLDRNDDKSSSQTANIATVFFLIGKHHLRLAPEVLDTMGTLRQKVTPRNRGMSERNEEILRQFDSDRNKRLLVELPSSVHNELTGKASLNKADALACQTALAIGILLCLPIRRKNLTGLDLEHHFVRRQDGTRQRVFVEIPASETKNREPVSFELPPRVVLLLDFYLEKCRAMLTHGASTWLFPGAKPGHAKSPERIAAGVVKLVYDRTGLRVTPHSFRHIAGKFVLDHDPSQFETVRRLLGHRSLDTTTAIYTGLNARVAAQVLDQTLDTLRGDGQSNA